MGRLIQVENGVDDGRSANDDVPGGHRPLRQEREVVRIPLDDMHGSGAADDVFQRLAQLPPANARTSAPGSATGASQVPARQT